jgi:hypothetical protein
VVLEDVARYAGVLVVGGPRFDSDRLRDRDLHVIDVAVVPERLEKSVAEPEDEDVLDRLLAEIVIDAEDLPLVEDGVEASVQLARRFQIVPERLFDDDAGPRSRLTVRMHGAGHAEMPDDRLVSRRRNGEIEEPVAG